MIWTILNIIGVICWISISWSALVRANKAQRKADILLGMMEGQEKVNEDYRQLLMAHEHEQGRIMQLLHELRTLFNKKP